MSVPSPPVSIAATLPAREPRARIGGGVWGLLALIGAFFVWSSLYYWPYLVDDAFISLRYARNLVDGAGLVYNPGQAVEGFSNFSWVMLEAAILVLGLPAITTLKIIGLASGVGIIFATHALSRRLLGDAPFGRSMSVFAAAFVGLHASLAVWSQSGLETVFYALLVLCTVLRLEHELAEEGARPLSALLFALTWLTRPDAPVYALYVLVRRLMAMRRRGGWSRSDTSWIVLAAGVIVPYELIGLWYYGQLFPMTHNAKAGGLEGMSLLLRQPLMREFWTQQGLGLQALLVAGALGSLLGRRRIPTAVWLVPLCGMIFIVYARMDWMPRHRFFVPLLPFLGIFLAFGLGELVRRVSNRSVPRALLLLVMAAMFADYARVQTFGGQVRRVGGAGALATRARGVWFGEVPEQLTQRAYPLEMEALGCLTSIPAEATICMRDVGFVGYLTMNPIWDTGGLFTPTVAAARHDERATTVDTMIEDLREQNPGCFYLTLTDNDRLSIDERVHRWLRTDETARGAYVKTMQEGRLTEGVSTVLYVRRDLAAGDVGARVADRLAAFEEYADRGRAKIEKMRAPAAGSSGRRR